MDAPADTPPVTAADAAPATPDAPDAPEAAPVPAPRARVRAWELGLVVALCSALYLPRLGSYSLWDPWEGHYAEVARRMLEERDWLRMRWQSENFWSKPVLTFWLMGGGMKLMGVGDDGGYSGEFVASHRAEWGLRLPFALFGVAGVALLWYMLARLYSKRAAWFAAVILATSPYYFFVSRQAITDMPSCALLVGALALFALAVHDDPDRPLPRWRGLTPFHGFLAAFGVVVLAQLVYFTFDLKGTRFFLAPGRAIDGRNVVIPFYLGTAGVIAWMWVSTRTTRQVTMYWFYLLCGIAVLAKGPVAPGLAGLTILCYLAMTGDWKLLRQVEIPRGILIAVAVALPWHFAMFCKDGNPWLHEYLNQHLLNRILKGVHGDRGTFRYFLTQLGVGFWPWVALVPAALAHFALTARPRGRAEKIRLLLGIWAVVAFFFFSVIETKFHHYVLPAVPALAALCAFWFDDLLGERVARAGVALGVTAALFVLLSLDLVPNQSKLVQLFIYRYDRSIPKTPPFSIDHGRTLFWFAVVVGVLLFGLYWARARTFVLYGLGAATLAFTVFCIDVLMIDASPHYGQRAEHEVYFKKRKIHGVDIVYTGLAELVADWGSGKDLRVRSAIPETIRPKPSC